MILTERPAEVLNTKEVLTRLGIKGILYDLDDTLIYTAEIFGRWMGIYADVIAREIGLDREMFYTTLSRINDEEYKKMGVSPLRWNMVVNRLEETFGDETGVIVGGLDILLNIYRTVPRARPGLLTTLQTMREAGQKQALITHANVEWTDWKIDSLGIRDWFDTILIADENGHKGAEHWTSAMARSGLLPRECLVVGDNLNGDVIPAATLGARRVWMPSPWSVYRDGVVPEGTVQIGEFDELLGALDRLR